MEDGLEEQIINPKTEGMTKREFLQTTGMAGLAFLVGCAGFDPRKPITSPEEFSHKSFQRWYKRKKLYNDRNPNLRRPHSPTPYTHGLWAATFKETLQKQVTPGLTYSVPANEILVAVAPGVVKEVDYIRGTGRAGGMYVEMNHPGHGQYPYFRSNFSHVSKPLVEEWQPIKRGDPICHVPSQYSNFAKLFTKEITNYVDPDNYGHNHTYMDYQTNQIKMDAEYETDPELMNHRSSLQEDALDKLDEHRRDHQEKPLLLNTLWHNKGGYKASRYSTVEKFRYLEEMYRIAPIMFPNLTEEEFQATKKEFYENQPIILTLPFKRR